MGKTSACFIRVFLVWLPLLLYSGSALSAISHSWAGESKNQRSDIVAVALRNFPPQYSVDKSGFPVGFAVDIFNAVARSRNINVKYIVVDDWEAAFTAVSGGQAEVLPNLGISKEREKLFDFTVPVETFAIVLFVRSSTSGIAGLDDLAGKKVATSLRNVAQDLLGKRDDLELVVRNTVEEALVDLISGHADVLAAPEPVALKIARDAGLEDRIKRVGPPLVEVKRAVAVRKGDAELHALLSEAVAEFIGTEEYQAIYAAWYGRPEPFWTVRRAMLAAGALLLAVTFGMALWRYRAIRVLNAELRSSEGKFRRLFEASPVPMALADQEERIESLNSRFIETFGYGPGDIRQAADWFALAYPDEKVRTLSLDAWRALVEACRRNGLWAEPMESRVVCKDGSVRHVVAKVSPIGNRLLVALHDITDRVRAEEGVKRSLREKEVMLKEIHHRVKNNLQIMNSLLYLQLEQITDPRSRSLIQESQTRIHSMALVHEELCRSSDMSSVDMKAYIHNLASYVGAGAGGSIQIETTIGDIHLPITKSAPFGLVVNELLTNAIKHAFVGRPAGRIRIHIQMEDGAVVMRISDNGIGLPEGFDPARSSSLGMTLVSNLVNQLHGAFQAYNENGANFVVRFPCQ